MSRARIRWEDAPHAAVYGFAGSIPYHLFSICWKTRRGDPDWLLETTLPGMAKMQEKDSDQAALRHRAEDWLAEFAASLGAALTGDSESPVVLDGPDEFAAYLAGNCRHTADDAWDMVPALQAGHRLVVTMRNGERWGVHNLPRGWYVLTPPRASEAVS